LPRFIVWAQVVDQVPDFVRERLGAATGSTKIRGSSYHSVAARELAQRAAELLICGIWP